jgi:4-hydroxythreonine-4-phosphate dehydrogenase
MRYRLSALPLLGITMGDPAGVGPEIIVKALTEGDVHQYGRLFILGDQEVLKAALERAGVGARLRIVSELSDVRSEVGAIDVLPISRLEMRFPFPGKPTTEGGKAMVQYVFAAVERAIRGELDAMVTCPINKALMHRAGYSYAGHTELIAGLTRARDYVMMLAGERLRVALVTIHCPIREVPLILDQERVYRTITITLRGLREDFGFASPRLAVAALNPHGGESGLFGSEEEEIILPAVKKARDEGHDVEGPFPPDTIFFRACSGEFHAVVAMYHDQGLIPLKILHFSDAVNITLGLSIVRTSVDHGTAYDIAGTGKADPGSLIAAIKTAALIVGNRKKRRHAQ